jgi:chromosome segregation ATPase
MSDQQTLFSRIGNWFKKNPRVERELPLDNDNGNGNTSLTDSRSTFLRPWARRDAAIQGLQEGFHTLTDLMSAVRDNLAKQTERQDELMKYLAHLPEALASTNESNRTQTETLKAIHQQMQSSGEQHRQVAGILEKMSDTSGGQQKLLDALRERVESISEQDRVISDTLQGVGSAMQNVSKTAHSSAEVLQQVRDNMHSRDSQLENIIRKQSNRFTTLLSIAIFLSIAAIASVCVIGYMLMIHGK